MTKQEIALAEAFKKSKPLELNFQFVASNQWHTDIEHVADVLQASNPNFKRALWLD